MSDEASSDEILSQETLTRRNNFEPRYLSIRRDGRITLPAGTVLDALRGTILSNTSGTFLDSLPDGNVIQGRTTGETTVGPNTSNSTVLASEETTIGTGDISELVILCSKDTTVSGDISRVIVTSSEDTIMEPTTFNFTGTSDLNFDSVSVTASNLSILRGNLKRCSITSSNDCQLQSIGTLPTEYLHSCGILNSTSCAIISREERGNELGIYSCKDCTMDGNGFTRNKAMIACRDSDVDTSFSAIILMAAAKDSVITGSCFGVIIAGNNAIVNNLDNVFCFSGTATDDDQAMLGVDLQVSGLGNNITTNDGYVQTERGLVQTYREPASLPETLLETDYHVHMPVAGGTFTLPLATVAGANFPLGTSREFYLSGPTTATPTVIATTSPNTFSLKPGWTQHTLAGSRGRVTLKLVNSLSPYWSVVDEVIYYAFFSSDVSNNFGVSPPQVDASILPASTGQASHQAITSAASHYQFGAMISSNAQTFTLGQDVVPGSGGFVISTPGVYIFTYQIDILTDTGAGDYIIRSDMVAPLTNTSLTGTYQETGGRNTTPGSKHITVSSGPVTVMGGIYQLRISQDGTDDISDTANITRVSINIQGNI